MFVKRLTGDAAVGGAVAHVETLASLDALLRIIDEQIAAIELPEIPKPAGRLDHTKPTTALQLEVEQLCVQRAVNIHELHRWMAEAERAIREEDDVRARDALVRHTEHLRLAQQADAQLTELRSLIADVRRSLSPTNERLTDPSSAHSRDE